MFISLTFALCIFCACFGMSRQSCECYPPGTRENSKRQSICSEDTFQCKCLPNVTGLKCDTCRHGYYNILSGQGCADCLCNKKGTKANTTCDSRGKCDCEVGYKGYRCDQRTETLACPCDVLIEDLLPLLYAEMAEIDQILRNPENCTANDAFGRRMAYLKAAIEDLRKGIKDPFSDRFDEIPSNITDNITSLISALLNYHNPNITQLTTNYDLVFDDMQMYRKKLNGAYELSNASDHDEAVSLIARESKMVLKDINNVLLLSSRVQNSYETAQTNVKNTHLHVKTLNEVYSKDAQKLADFKQFMPKLIRDLKNSHARAAADRDLVQHTLFLSNNVSFNSCGAVLIHDYGNNAEETLLSNSLKNVLGQQKELEELFGEMNETYAKALLLEKQNKKDKVLFNAVYTDALGLLDKLDAVVAASLLHVAKIDEQNEDNLFMLQNELEHLIKKLNLFLDLLSKLEALLKDNEKFLENLQEQIRKLKSDLEELKDLNVVLAAVADEEDLNNAEYEIDRAEQYFQVWEEIEEMKNELDSLDDIVLQLQQLPDALCSADVRPEGKLP